MATIPLFPLSTVLFPHGRLPLQIFEPRYVELISDCLKNDTGFGVVWLREGREVVPAGKPYLPKLAGVGTYAKIVDWNSLANGLLGVTIEGYDKFLIQSFHQQANHLHVAEVEWLDKEPFIPLPDYGDDMCDLLRELVKHPHLATLNIDPNINDVDTLGCLLSQLLPIEEAIKYSLFSAMDPLTRIEQLMDLLEEMGQ